MIIPNKVKRVAKIENKSLHARTVKLMEEVGELAAEVLRLHGEKGARGKSYEAILDDAKLEAVDCMLMSMDILVRLDASEEEISSIMNSQLKKWEKQLKDRAAQPD